MCFSTEASFISGATLTVIGILSIRKVKKPSEMMFGAIPLLFGIQQFAEGFVWLSLTNPEYSNMGPRATWVFIFFAQVVWPAWVPVSVLFFEKEKKRRVILYCISFIGILVSAILFYRLSTENITAVIQEHHISYVFGEPSSVLQYFSILYVIATVFSPFISANKRMWLLGATIALSYILTKIFYEDYLVSVWCFLAALISALVYWIVNWKTKEAIHLLAAHK